jgi:serine/threonine protein kinase
MGLELAEGDLFNKIRKLYPKVLEPIQIRYIFYNVIRAIDYIHTRKIAHNDIKLDNILMFEN